MEDIVEDFEQRVEEINSYLNLLEVLSNPNAEIVTGKSKPKQISNIALKTMKATCFLMLYNLVESSIKASMVYLYERINDEDKKLNEFDSFVKEIWISQEFKRLDPNSSNKNSYRVLIKKMLSDVLAGVSVSLNAHPKELPISGNLDAKSIKELLGRHKIPTHTHYRALGGGELRTVKDKRNSLAHGSESFTDCGQQYTIESLISIKKQTVVFVRSSLKNIKKYIEKSKYVA